MREEPQHLFREIYTSFYSFWSQSFCGVWERQTETGRQRQTTISTQKLLLFNIPSCVIFKTPLSTSAIQPGVFDWTGLKTIYSSAPYGPPPLVTAKCSLRTPAPGDCKVTLSQVLMIPIESTDKQASTYDISWHQQLPMNHVKASANLHRCVSDWRFAQGSMCDTPCFFLKCLPV